MLIAIPCFGELTHIPVFYPQTLLCTKSTLAALSIVILYKAVRLLDRDLSKVAILVEYIEKVAFADGFSRQIPYPTVSEYS